MHGFTFCFSRQYLFVIDRYDSSDLYRIGAPIFQSRANIYSWSIGTTVAIYIEFGRKYSNIVLLTDWYDSGDLYWTEDISIFTTTSLNIYQIIKPLSNKSYLTHKNIKLNNNNNNNIISYIRFTYRFLLGYRALTLSSSSASIPISFRYSKASHSLTSRSNKFTLIPCRTTSHFLQISPFRTAFLNTSWSNISFSD